METNGACTTFHLNLPVTINALPTLNSSLTPPAICGGSSFTYTATSATAGATFAWTRAVIVGITEGASGGAGNVNEVLTNTTIAPINVTYVYVTTAGGCSGPPQNVVVTVNPAGNVNDPGDQVVCSGTYSTPVTFTTNNLGGTTSFTWINDTPGIGLGASGSGNIPFFTAINGSTAPVMATVTVTPHFTNGMVTCDGPTQSFTITVNPKGQVNDPTDQVVCNGTSTAAVNFTTSNTVGTTTYTWTNNVPGIGLAAGGTGNIASFTAGNAGTTPVVATITVTPHFDNASLTCDGPVQTFTITVNPTGQVNDPASQVVCSGSTTSAINFSTVNLGGTTTYSWTNDLASIGIPVSGTGNIGSFVASNATTAPVIANLTVTPHFSNGGVTCDGPVKTFTFTVNPAGQVNDPTDQVVCNGSATTAVVLTTANTGGATTYSWTNNTTGINLASGGTGDIPSFTATNASTSPVVATITITPHFDNGSVTCNGPTQTFTITVNPTGQVNSPASQVVCNGTLTAPVNFTTNNTGGATTYSWTNDTPGIGLLAAGAGNIAAFTATNAGISPVVATITVTPHFANGGVTCDGAVKTFTITVNPTAEVDVPANQVVCNGTSTAAVNFSTTRTGGTPTYSWTNDNTGIGLGASGSGNIPIFTALNGGTSPELATITITPHFTNGSATCDGPTQTFTITVNPTAQVNDPADQVVCNGAPTTVVAFTTGNTVGTTTYTWTNNATSINLAANGTGDIASFTAANIGTSPTVATITVTPHFDNGSITCNGPVQTFTITVNPTAQVNDPADQVVCNSSMTTAVNFTSVNTGGAKTYTWTNDNTSIGLAAGGTGNIAAFAATNGGTAPVMATVTVTPHFANGGATCDGPAQTFTITVNPTAQVNVPANQVVCNGAPTTLVTFTTANTGGTTTYSWTNSATGINLAASGTGDIPSFTASNITTAPIVATITVTPHFDNGSVTCNGPAQIFTITVNPTGQVNVPANQVVCNGSMTAAVNFTTSNTVGVTTYTWTNDNGAIGLGVSGTGNIGSFGAINATTSPVIANLTVTPHFSNGGVTCDGPAQAFTITINPTGQVNDPTDQVVCNGSSTTTVIFATANTGGTTTYTWTNDNTTIGLAAAGSGNITAFAGTNASTSPVVATITITPHFDNGSVTCDGPTQTFTITVNPTGQVNSPASQVVCNGTLTAAVNFTTNNTVGGTTYSWTNDTPGIGLSGAGAGNIAAFTATNAGTAPVVATITVTPHFANGGVTCDGAVKTFTITVNPTAEVDVPANQVVCNGASTAAVNFSTTRTGGTPTYSWTNDNTGIGLGASGSGNIPIFTALNGGTSPELATITVTPHFTNGSVTCDGPTQTFTITVNPTAQVNDPADQVVCNGAPTTVVAFTTGNTVGTTTYTWTNNATSINLAANGTGDIASFTAANIGTSPTVATITVTPHFDNGSITCNGPVQTFTITVNPTAQVNDPADQVVCNSSMTTAVNFTSVNTGGAKTYTWTNDNTSIGLAAGGTGNIAAFAATNGGTAPVMATVTVTPHFANGGATCDGPAQTFTITVNPTAQVNVPANQVVCNGAPTTLVTFTTANTGGTTTYSWTNSATGINLAASGTGDIPSFTASNITTAPIVATITVTPHFDNGSVTCNGPAQIFTITVNPTGQVNVPASQVICNGLMTAPVNFTTIIP